MLLFASDQTESNLKQARGEGGCSKSLAEYYRERYQISAHVCGSDYIYDLMVTCHLSALKFQCMQNKHDTTNTEKCNVIYQKCLFADMEGVYLMIHINIWDVYYQMISS